MANFLILCNKNIPHFSKCLHVNINILKKHIGIIKIMAILCHQLKYKFVHKTMYS